jgi:hypothetical protein
VAFETVIAGDLEAAAEQGSTIRDRLVAIHAALPSLDALDPRQPLMGLVVTDVQELVAVADVLDPPGQPGDPVLLLVEGEVALAAVDAALGAPVGGDLVGRHCPTVRYDAVPVAFPPPPDNLELGLPERVAGWRVDARVAVLGSSMADILERRGVDVGGIRAIRVGLTRGSEWANMEVYDDFPEPVARFLPALRDRLLSFPTEGVTSTVAGFDVIRYEDRSDPSLSLSIAQRGDRVIVVQSIAPEDFEAILAAMPE